jgi:Zn-dependent M28 family amino/carboxypeptidase
LFTQNPLRYGKNFFKKEPYPERNLFYRSDNYAFAVKGIPAHTIMVTSDYDEHYHKLTDETKTLNFEFMAKVVTAASIAIEPVIDGSIKPKRIRPSIAIRY